MAETAGIMPFMAKDVRIEQLWIPDSLDAPDAADFLAAVEVGRKVRMQTWGSDDLAYTPLEKLLELAAPYERQVILVAKVDGRIPPGRGCPSAAGRCPPPHDFAVHLGHENDLALVGGGQLKEFFQRGIREVVTPPRLHPDFAAHLYCREEIRCVRASRVSGIQSCSIRTSLAIKGIIPAVSAIHPHNQQA